MLESDQNGSPEGRERSGRVNVGMCICLAIALKASATASTCIILSRGR